GASLNGGVEHGATFDVGVPSGYAHHDHGAEQRVLTDHLADEVAQHRLGDQVVGDDAVAHGTADDDAARGAAQHRAGVRAHRHDAVVRRRIGHHGGLVEHDAAALDVDEHVGRTQVDADVLGEHHARTAASLLDRSRVRAFAPFPRSRLLAFGAVGLWPGPPV